MPLLAMNGGVPLAKPAWPVWPQADERTRAAVLASVNSGRWAISGPYRGCESFESKFSKAFSDYNGVPYCVLTSNGSSALVAALAALGVGPGDEVLVPGLTWVACATAPLRVGASPIFVDLTPGGLTMCPIAAADRLRSGAVKAIILVHQSCALADLSAFAALAKAFGVALIEDCSQAHGAKWRGMPVGTVGKVGVFSMQQTKLLTCGEGGGRDHSRCRTLPPDDAVPRRWPPDARRAYPRQARIDRS